MCFLVDDKGPRDRIVVETGDVPKLHVQIGRRFAVRSEKGSILSRVLVESHGDVKDLLNCRRGRYDF